MSRSFILFLVGRFYFNLTHAGLEIARVKTGGGGVPPSSARISVSFARYRRFFIVLSVEEQVLVPHFEQRGNRRGNARNSPRLLEILSAKNVSSPPTTEHTRAVFVNEYSTFTKQCNVAATPNPPREQTVDLQIVTSLLSLPEHSPRVRSRCLFLSHLSSS